MTLRRFGQSTRPTIRRPLMNRVGVAPTLDLFAHRLGLVHFRFGLLVIHAAGQLQRVDLLALGELQHFVLQILGL